MQSYWEFVDFMYSPCIYFLYVAHVLYLVEFSLVFYIKVRYGFATKFVYYAYQQHLKMSRFVALRTGVWVLWAMIDSSSQMQGRIASTCEPSFSASILLLLSIGYCVTTIISAKKNDVQ